MYDPPDQFYMYTYVQCMVHEASKLFVSNKWYAFLGMRIFLFDLSTNCSCSLTEQTNLHVVNIVKPADVETVKQLNHPMIP